MFMSVAAAAMDYIEFMFMSAAAAAVDLLHRVVNFDIPKP